MDTCVYGNNIMIIIICAQRGGQGLLFYKHIAFSAFGDPGESRFTQRVPLTLQVYVICSYIPAANVI